MNKNEYIETKTKIGVVWKLKDKGVDDVENLEIDAKSGDVVAMVLYLAAVVLTVSTVCSALLAGVLRTVVLKANPAVNQDWLGDETVFIFWMTFTMITLAQVALMVVHARIGTLIASRME